ncbi:head-tail connector protein, partial [[Clostridium] symbiosum]
MLEKVKMALRIKTTAFDSEIEDLIQAALKDLEIAGVGNKNPDDPL